MPLFRKSPKNDIEFLREVAADAPENAQWLLVDNIYVAGSPLRELTTKQFRLADGAKATKDGVPAGLNCGSVQPTKKA